MEHIIIITTREFNQLFEGCKSEINIPNLEKLHTIKRVIKGDDEAIETSKKIGNNLSTEDVSFNLEFKEAVSDFLNGDIDETTLLKFLKENDKKLPDDFFNITSVLDNLPNDRFKTRKFLHQVKNKNIEVYGYRCYEERDDILKKKPDGFLTALITDIAASKSKNINQFFNGFRITLIVHGDDIGYESIENDKLECLKNTNRSISNYFDMKIKKTDENGNEVEVFQHNIHPFSHQAGLFYDIIKSKKYNISSAYDIYYLIKNYHRIEKEFKESEKDIFNSLKYPDDDSAFKFEGLKSKLF